MKTTYIKLFANCIPVLGASRATICDLQRSIFSLVPHNLVEMFDEYGLVNIEKYEKGLDEENRIIFKEYLELLENQEFIFYCTKAEASHFPLLSMEWDYPSQATNCIIDISSKSHHDYVQILNIELDEVNCRYVQFRHYDESTLEFWQRIIDIVNKNEIKAIDLIIKDTPNLFTHDEIAKWATDNRKIRSIILHSSFENRQIQDASIGFSSVISIQETITNSSHCGVIHPSYFAINIETFTESQQHNTCLNRKISIDVNGDIKNCPSMAKSYGNINDMKLIDVVNNPAFQQVWHIKKMI